MAEDSWPSPTHSGGDLTDREYELLTRSYLPDALYGLPADPTAVYADSSGLNVKVRANEAGNVRGFHWFSGSTDVSLTITSNSSGNTRVDLVVLRLTRSTWNVRAAVVTGIAGSGAPTPTQDIGNTGVWELPIAQVTVPSGDAAIDGGQVRMVAPYIGGQPLICTSSTHPPHSPGLMIWETDTKRAYVSDGVSAWLPWRLDSGWAFLGAADGWSLTHGRIRNLNGLATMNLNGRRVGNKVGKTTISSIATVPAGFAPSDTQELVFYISGGFVAHGYVTTSGVCVIDDFWVDILTGNSAIAHVASWPIG